jgi:hypothetical protein
VKDQLFTIAEANALIPRLEIIMAKLQQQGLAFRDGLNDLARHTGQPPEELTTMQILELRPELHPLVEEMEALLQELDSWGVHLKGLDLGLIDFPAEVEGELVLLCWQYGEKELGYYHSLEGGFAGRKPLDPQAERPRYLQ